jgi:hypothetical protein
MSTAGDRLVVVVHRGLLGRGRHEVEPRVEPTLLADRRDPVAHPGHLGDRRHEVVGLAQGQQLGAAIVDRVALGEGRMPVDDVRASLAVGGQQHTGLLEALADGSETVGVLDVVAVVGLDPAAGEHVHPTAERGRQRTAQHEHLDAVTLGMVADQHHRRRRPDGHIGGIEEGSVGHLASLAARARLDGPGDDRSRPGTQCDRRDRHHRHR